MKNIDNLIRIEVDILIEEEIFKTFSKYFNIRLYAFDYFKFLIKKEIVTLILKGQND